MIKWILKILQDNILRRITPWITREPRVRLLKPSEYHKLKGLRGDGLPDNDDWIPKPGHSTVIVAETQGKIVGFWVIRWREIHIEPVWTRPDFRGNLTWRMWNKLRHILGERDVYAYISPNHSGYIKKKTAIKHLGFKYLGDLYVRQGD